MKTLDRTTNGHQPLTASPGTDLPQVDSPSPSSSSTTLAPVDSPVLPPNVDPAAGPAAEPGNSPSPGRKRRYLLGVTVGVGAIAASAFGYQAWQYASSHVETDNATVVGHLHTISARMSGNVQQVLVADHQQVQAGQILVKLDPRDYQVKLQQAQADLAAAAQKANSANLSVVLAAGNAVATTTQSQGDVAKALAAIAQAQSQVATAQAQVTESQTGVPRAEAQLAQSKANLQKAQTDLNRFAQLFGDGAISQRDLDTARQAYQVSLAQQAADVQGVQQSRSKVTQTQQSVETARAGLEAAKASLTAAEGSQQQAQAKGIQTEVSQSDFGTAKTAIAQAQVALKNAQLQLSYTNIVAPVGGRIGHKVVEVGQQIQPGTPLMALVSQEAWITANFKETQLEKMHPGQVVDIKLDSFPHHTFRGHIDSLAPAAGSQFALLPPDNATGNFTKVVQRIPVKVVFDADSLQGYEDRITPGMSAAVTVDIRP